jgi:hypothetical protein
MERTVPFSTTSAAEDGLMNFNWCTVSYALSGSKLIIIIVVRVVPMTVVALVPVRIIVVIVMAIVVRIVPPVVGRVRVAIGGSD